MNAILVIWDQYLPTKVLTVNVGTGKKHNNEKEVYLDSYLRRFMIDNLDINQILNN